MSKQQTAVEWLIEQIERKNGKEFASFYSEFIQQAKQMESKNAFEIFKAEQDSMEEGGKSFEQYYNNNYDQ